jgi:hypothetical protein
VLFRQYSFLLFPNGTFEAERLKGDTNTGVEFALEFNPVK